MRSIRRNSFQVGISLFRHLHYKFIKWILIGLLYWKIIFAYYKAPNMLIEQFSLNLLNITQ
jgi:hypothetical protein